MINLNFGLWWAGSKLSYLRYLTFKSLRHFHPHSRIQLYTNGNYDSSHNQGVSQEFTKADAIREDYMDRLEELDVEIVRVNHFSAYSPNHQSDCFRWWFLRYHGGFYLDTDQIILRPFKSLPLKKHKFIYSVYSVNSPFALSDPFCPVGVLGASEDSKVVQKITQVIPEYYKPDDYNCIGPLMFADIVKKQDMSEGFNAPSEYFYPAPICDRVDGIYSGERKFSDKAYALHWFGGYDPSQKFNRAYTEEFAQSSKDTISTFLREKRII